MSEEDRQQIKRVKEFVDYFYSRDISYDKVDTQEIYDIEGVLALIEKQDKIINKAIKEIEILRQYFDESSQGDFIRILEILKDKNVIDW